MRLVGYLKKSLTMHGNVIVKFVLFSFRCPVLGFGGILTIILCVPQWKKRVWKQPRFTFAYVFILPLFVFQSPIMISLSSLTV